MIFCLFTRFGLRFSSENKMPCFCAYPYSTDAVVAFACGHLVHSFCASTHIANRLSKDDDDDDDDEDVDMDKCVSSEIYLNNFISEI